MKKFICTVCGYIYEGETAPEKCPFTFTKVKQLLKSVRCVKLLLLNSKKWKKLKVVCSL